MKTTNWQTKALALFIAAVAFWLTTACGGDSGIQIITPAAPCGPELPLTPSKEYFTWEGAKVPSGQEKWLEAAKNPLLIGIQDPEGRERFIHSMRMTARAERLRPEYERVQAIVKKYDYLFRVPSTYNTGENRDVFNWGPSTIRTENGLLTDQLSIFIRVDVHPRLLEPSIPECLDGYPVIFEYHPDFGKPLEDY